MDNLFNAGLTLQCYFTHFPLFYCPGQQIGQFTSFSTQKSQNYRQNSIKIQAQSNEAFPQSSQTQKVQKQIKIKKTKSQKKKKHKPLKVSQHLKQRKDNNFSVKHQKKGRNLPSIIFRLFVLFIFRQHQSAQRLRILVDPIANKYGLNDYYDQFLKAFSRYFAMDKNYVARNSVEDVVYNQIQDPQFSLVFRILFRNFLKVQIFPTVLPYKKLARKNKVKEIKFAKEVFNMIFGNKDARKQNFSNISA